VQGDEILAEYSYKDSDREWTDFVLTSNTVAGTTVYNASTTSSDRLLRIDYLFTTDIANKPGVAGALRNDALVRNRLRPTDMTINLAINNFRKTRAASRLAINLAVGSAVGLHRVPVDYNITQGITEGIDVHIDIGTGFNPAAGRVIFDGRAIIGV
jgi:hypothetical protein